MYIIIFCNVSGFFYFFDTCVLKNLAALLPVYQFAVLIVA